MEPNRELTKYERRVQLIFDDRLKLNMRRLKERDQAAQRIKQAELVLQQASQQTSVSRVRIAYKKRARLLSSLRPQSKPVYRKPGRNAAKH